MEISKQSLDNHYALLQGYKKEREKCLSLQERARSKRVSASAWRRIKFDLAYNSNAIFLHKMFFEDTAETDRQGIKGILEEYIENSGSEKAFYEDCLRTATSVRNGWVLISYCPMGDNIVVEGIDQHNLGGTSYRWPIACLDMWEHAYAADFGIDKSAYFGWWVNRMNWENAMRRLERITSGHLDS